MEISNSEFDRQKLFDLKKLEVKGIVNKKKAKLHEILLSILVFSLSPHHSKIYTLLPKK